jgi:hemoglobin-like flavoprotein
MDERTLELFNNSYESCVRHPRFLKRFYEIFLEASPEVREKFKGTDFEKQVRIIEKSLLLLTISCLGTKAVDEEIARLGERHGPQGMKIGAHLYDLWLDALLRTVSEFDPKWSQAVGDSWRKMFEPCITKLKSYS